MWYSLASMVGMATTFFFDIFCFIFQINLFFRCHVYFLRLQCIIKQLSDSVFVICKIINVSVRVICLASGSADNSYLDIDNSAYHKNLIQSLLIIFRDPRLQFNNALSFISLINNKNTVNSSKNYKINNLHDVQQLISTADPLLLFAFLFHSASMAEQNISPGLEIVENLDASGAIDGNEGT